MLTGANKPQARHLLLKHDLQLGGNIALVKSYVIEL